MTVSLVARRYQNADRSVMASASTNLEEIDDLINFALGDPDVTTDSRITRAAMGAALSGRTHYTDAAGCLSLRTAISQFHAAAYGECVRSDQIMVTTSACHGLYLALQVLCDPGDDVVIIEPYFTCYEGQIRAAGAHPVVVNPGAEGGWRVTPAQLDAAITDRTRAVILNTPSNPSGVHYSRDELLALCEVIRRKDIVAIADDIYTAYVFDGDFAPLASLPGMSRRTITVRSFSKDWAMTGWRIGYLVAAPEFIAVAKDLNENIVFSAPEPVQAAAEEALRLADEIRPAMHSLYRSRVLHAYQQLRTVPGLSAARPGGGIYLWVDVRKTGMSGREFAAFMLEHAHVAVIPGDAFGPHCGGFVRLALTVDEETTDAAYARMAQALSERNGS